MMEQCKEKLNIAMFGQKRIPSREGGVEIVVEELCTRMVAQGHNVTCYNRGVSSARNIGLNNAHGEYVCFFDPGDEADSDFVMYLYKLLLSEKADLAICSYNFKMENGQILDRNRFYEIVDKNTIFNQEEALTEIIKVYGKFCGHVWDKLFIRSKIGAIRFDENIHNCEDTLFDVQYIKNCQKVILGPEVHYDYIQSNGGVTRGICKMRYFTLPFLSSTSL